MSKRLDTPSQQCSTCRHFALFYAQSDTGRCDNPARRPDPEYGYVVQYSDGCKHWQEEKRTA